MNFFLFLLACISEPGMPAPFSLIAF
uniref:Uncharacterized protein n=1 Tax=Rhizophora mucronata TaxID=61149 RepID=A0A2P2P2B9_RHIMU